MNNKNSRGASRIPAIQSNYMPDKELQHVVNI